MPQRPLIALLTDFGLQDAYVASMKAVILGIAPNAALVDITHAVPPQDIYAGAFLLETCIDTFPPEATYVCVVDPGVGTDRLPLVLQTPSATFVGPDNGLFSYVLARSTQVSPSPTVVPPTIGPAPLPPSMQARIITNRTLMRPEVSGTFHGRDIFAPVAARLAQGLALDAVGPALDHVQAFAPPQPRLLPDGILKGDVVHIDAYGNLITNLRPTDLPPDPVLQVGAATVLGLSQTYGSDEHLIALTGSSGYVEIAAPNGNAAEALGVQRWASVTVRPAY